MTDVKRSFEAEIEKTEALLPELKTIRELADAMQHIDNLRRGLQQLAGVL